MRYDTLIIEPLRDMTSRVMSFIPTLLIALGILFIGWIAVKMLTKLIVTFLRAIEFDTLAAKVGLAKVMKDGGIKQKPSNLVGCLFYWVAMVMILITAVKAIGLTMVGGLLDSVLAYIPSVFTGAFVLIIGMLLARFVSTVIYVAAKNTDMPAPHMLARLSKYAIVVYVAIAYLKEVGFVSIFVGTNYTIFIGGVVFSLALAFGLAGKEIAAKYLDVLK